MRVGRLIGESLRRTYHLVFTLTPRSWLALVSLATFISAGARFNYTIISSYLPLSTEGLGTLSAHLSYSLDTILGISSIIGTIIFIYYLIGSILDFIFTKWLLEDKQPANDSLKIWTPAGIRLFGIRIALLIGFTAVFAIQYLIFNLRQGDPMIEYGLVFINTIAVIGYTVTNGFMTDFLVPLRLIHADYQTAARTLITDVRDHPKAYLSYTGIRVTLNTVISIGTLFIGSMIAIITGIPVFDIIGSVLSAPSTGGTLSTIIAQLTTFTGTIVGLIMSFLLFVQLPVKVFLRYLPIVMLEQQQLVNTAD